MNDANYACPYCNAALPVLATPPTGEKQACPRCGEMIPASRWCVDGSLGQAIAPGEPKPQTTAAARPPGIRKTLFIVLGIMFTMAFVGMCYALWTTRLRQSRHPWLHTKLEPIALRQPLELPGLAYLPADCVFVAGLHIGEMVEDAKVGKPLLAEPRPTGLSWALKQIARTTGMNADHLDHVVLGGRDVDKIVMVVRTRRKISLDKIGDARPKKSYLHQDRPTYEFVLQAGSEAVVWQADDQTLIYAIRFPLGPDVTGEEHLKRMDLKARAVEDVIPANLREIVQQRLPRNSFAWITADTTKLGLLGTFLAAGGERNMVPVAGTKRLVLGIAPIEGLTVIANLQAEDAKAAGKLVTTLEQTKLPENIARKVEVTPPEQPQHWVTLQLRGDVAAVREWAGGKKQTEEK